MKNFFQKHFGALLLVLISAVLILSCKSERNYKAVREEVIDIHNNVMADGEQAARYRMILDSLSKIKLKVNTDHQLATDTTADQKKISMLIAKLDKADENMMEWMQRFEPDTEGKSNAEAIQYFEAEMIKIKRLDLEYEAVLKASDTYLKKFNIKGLGGIPSHDHSKH
ncbi:hypothetical protein [Pedobacter sp. N23S346]|uniref:hypothetical protein n=1 Tax=Pedobacter sp. N23S346 TaxID=3402750 RepID=UPI003AD7C9E2